MKIFIPNHKSPHTGKDFFCCRLYAELKRQGANLIDNPEEPHDISLHNVKLKKNKANSKFKVLRIDGVCHNSSMDYKKQNKQISKSLRSSAGVIYQSQFSKKICDKYLGVFKGKSVVINNGADPKFYKNILPIDTGFKNVFLSFSRWRPHKRLRDIIESFLLSDIEDSCLFISGDITQSGLSEKEINKYFSLFNVKCLDSLSQEEMAGYLKSSKAFIHLCWADSCPNAVVEAICSGTTVISNNVTGTPEIVSQSNGILVDIDKEFDLNPCDLYNPPVINRQLIADAIVESSINKREIINSHVNINNVANRYYDFFERIVNGH